MPLPITIEDGPVEVRDRALVVAVVPVAPNQAQVQRVKNYTARLTSPAGSVDMAIDGSTTPVAFRISATADTLITVASVRLVFHSSNMKIAGSEARRFGPVSSPGLTNGLQLNVVQNGTVTEIFLDPVKVLGDFYRYAGGNLTGVNTALINDIDAISAGVDYFMVAIVLPHPVALYPGTEDYIGMPVSDDLSGIVLFETQAYGTQEPA